MTVLLGFLVIFAFMLVVGVITGVLLRAVFPDIDLGQGIIAGVLGASFSSYMVYRVLTDSMMIEEVEEVAVLGSVADFPRYLEQRTRQPRQRKPRQKSKPPSSSSPTSDKEG